MRLTKNILLFKHAFKSTFAGTKSAVPIRTTTMGRNLAAFDFDHTIVHENSDMVMTHLLPKGSITESVKKLVETDGWTAFMQGVFELMHLHGISEENIVTAMQQMPETPGMVQLIKTLCDELNYDVIIISDSNSYLINLWLEKQDIKQKVLKVFTNPAHFTKGVLRISMYHLQTECKLCSRNLCKGKVLTQFIQDQTENGVVYHKIVYAGDGSNDFCPILQLAEGDLACVRDKYVCSKLIQDSKEGKPLARTGLTYNIKANVLVWNSGLEILDAVKALS